jgi:hypothetical protein
VQKKLRIAGVDWTLKLTKEKQVFNGRESLVAIDVEHREIRLSSRVRQLIAQGISGARSANINFDLRPPEAKNAAPPAATTWLSGCYLCHLVPFPWWEESSPSDPQLATAAQPDHTSP